MDIDFAKMAGAAAAARKPGETSEKFPCLFNSEGFVCPVWQYFPSLRILFTADGDVDADGGVYAYHPKSQLGLDALANAGRPGNWWGLATDRIGNPFVQGENDPAPGFYISTTSYQRPRFPRNDPRRYLDSETIPFVVVQSTIRNRAKGVVLGSKSRVTNLRNGKVVEDGMVGDTGPLSKIGEISIAMAIGLGLDGNPRTGGVDEPILQYELFPDIPATINGELFPLIRAVALKAA